MSPEQALQLKPHKTTLQEALDCLHLAVLQHGLIHLDIKASNIGVCFKEQPWLQLLDWNKAANNISLARLPNSPSEKEICKYIFELTDGIVCKAIESKLHKLRQEQEEIAGPLQRLMNWFAGPDY